MKIVFAGNCQAYALCYLYDRHVGKRLGQDVAWVDAWDEHRLDDWKRALVGADLLVLQHFTSPARVPVRALAGPIPVIAFPDIRGNFLWPFGNTPRPDNPQPYFKGGGPYDGEVGDAFLNRLILAGTPAEEGLLRYLEMDIVREARLDRVFELTLDQQRRRDEATGFAFADYVESRFRTERLFNTQGHLSLALFHRLAAEVYGRMGVAPDVLEAFVRSVRRAPFEPYHDAPVHPGVIAFYGLSYLSTEPQYHHVQEGRFSLEERVLRYMENRWSPDLHEGCFEAERRNWPRALDLLDRGLANAPGSAHGHAVRGEVLQRMGHLQEALQSLELAAGLEPEDEDILNKLAHAREVAI